MDDVTRYDPLLNHEQNDNDIEGEMGEFLIKLGKATVPVSQSKALIWDKIESIIDEKKNQAEVGQSKVAPIISLWKYAAVAAAIVVAITVVLLIPVRTEKIQFRTASGEMMTKELPDGSHVMMNALSSVSYMRNKWSRNVSLSGEAFFEVTEGDRFVVSTDMGDVEVQGTSFNIFARSCHFEVSCKTGKVQVTIPTKSIEEVVMPGEIISLKADTVMRKRRLTESVGQWQAGEFYFDSQPLSEVLDELQRQFNITIEFDDLEKYHFSGYFTNKSLNHALDMVCLPLKLKHHKVGRDTIILSETSGNSEDS